MIALVLFVAILLFVLVGPWIWTIDPTFVDIRNRNTGPSWAHPVIAGGKLYLRYDDTLYAFDIKGP